MVSVFPSTPFSRTRLQDIHVKTDALGSKTTSKPLLLKGSFCISSDIVLVATVRDPEIQQFIQHTFTRHNAQSVFSVHESLDSSTCRFSAGCLHSN